MERWLPIAVIALMFLGLLGVRVAILLILRRGETTGPRTTERRWPNATVIKTNPADKPPSE